MFTHVITRAYRDSSSVLITSTESVSADSERNFDGVIAAATNNVEIDIALTAANLKTVSLSCDKAVTIKTNSSGSPQDTITLVAGQNLLWSLSQDGAGKIPFSDDITKMYVTNQNGMGITAAFKVRTLSDQTP